MQYVHLKSGLTVFYLNFHYQIFNTNCKVSNQSHISSAHVLFLKSILQIYQSWWVSLLARIITGKALHFTCIRCLFVRCITDWPRVGEILTVDMIVSIRRVIWRHNLHSKQVCCSFRLILGEFLSSTESFFYFVKGKFFTFRGGAAKNLLRLCFLAITFFALLCCCYSQIVKWQRSFSVLCWALKYAHLRNGFLISVQLGPSSCEWRSPAQRQDAADMPQLNANSGK